jgi:hypothetical protein
VLRHPTKKTFLYLTEGYRFFSEMSEKRLDFQDFCNIIEFILCPPGSNAPTERIFSVMNTMWSKEKSRLNVETMTAMLVVRQNCVMEFEKFYDKVLKDQNLLILLHLRNIHGMIVVKYSPPHSLHKFLYVFCH